MFIETVKIGELSVQMCACASVLPAYRNIFGEDFLKVVSADTQDMSVYIRMGFVMAMFAEKTRAEVNKLTVDNFYEWLDQFSTGDMVNAIAEIATVFIKESGGSVAAKKNKSAPSGK